MTSTVPAEAAPVKRVSLVARTRRILTVLFGPLWVRTFRDPVREGHLRLDSLSAAEKLLARCGLVLLAVLLGSVLFSDVWRTGTLYQLTGENSLRFVPIAVFPVALLGLFLAWSIVFWGALDAGPLVRVVVAVLFLATESGLAIGSVGGLGFGPWILEHGARVIQVGYYVAPGALIASALLHPLVRQRARLSAVVTAMLRVVVLLALLVLFGAILWAHLEADRLGYPIPMPGSLDLSVTSINAFLIPLVYVAAITVIDFALDVSSSLTEPTRVLSRRWLLLVLVLVLAAKVLFQVVLEWDSWTALLTYQPAAFIRTVVSIVLLAALVAVVTRFAPSEDYVVAKERAIYGSSFVLATPYLLSVFGTGVAIYLITQWQTDVGSRVNDAIPYVWMADWGIVIAAAIAVLAGLALMRRSKGGFGDELGSALVVVGGWVGCQTLLAQLDLAYGFSYPTVDLVITAGVLVVLLVRWRSVRPATLVMLTTLLVFSWLVMSRGDYISFIGGLVGLPGILVVVFGVVLTLASGSAFASQGSKRLPTEARPLLFVGYLLLSVVILFWVEVTHEPGQDLDSLAAFYFLGIPMAFWLAARRIVAVPEVTPPPSSDAPPAPLPPRP